MPDEVSFFGLAGNPDLISDIFHLNLYLYVCAYFCSRNNVQTCCYSLFHKGRSK